MRPTRNNSAYNLLKKQEGNKDLVECTGAGG